MKHLNMTVDKAYDFVKQKRPEISPNLGFMGQLLEYQRALTGTGGHNQQQDAKATSNKRTLPTILRPVVGELKSAQGKWPTNEAG